MEQKIEPGKISENTYLIDVNMLGMEKITSMYVVKSEKSALIDGGTQTEAQHIIKSLKDFGLLPVDYIIISHAHWDHYQAVPAILEEMAGKEVEILAHPDAIPILEDPSTLGYDFGVGELLPVKGAKPIKEGDVVDLGGGVELEVIETPGHTPDSISLLDKSTKNIFVSDAVVDKTDSTTFVPCAMPPSFDPDTFVKTLDKLRGIDWESICLGHYGMYYGADVKNILDEAKEAWEKTWKVFDDNKDKLGDLEYMTKTVIDAVMPNSETIKRTGMMFAQGIVHWLIDGYKMYKKI